MAYTPIGWLNDQAPAINQTNLNYMDQGIVDADEKAVVAGNAVGSSLDGLVNGLDEYELKSLISIPGTIYYDNGTDKNSSTSLSSYHRSDYIVLSKGAVINYSRIRVTTAALIAVYDMEKNYDLNNSVQSSTTISGSGTFIMPYSGYIRLSCRNTELEADASFKVLNEFGERFKKLEQVDYLLKAVNPILIGQSSIKQYPEKYINSNGIVTNKVGSSIGVSELFYCNAGDKIKFKLSNQTNYKLLAVYDEDMTMVYSVPATGYSNPVEMEYTFGDNDRYFRIAGILTESYYKNYYVEFYSAMNPDIVDKVKGIDERVKILEENDSVSLPDYWLTYMESKIPELLEKDILIGNNGDSFIFVTDIHVPRNAMYSPKLFHYLFQKTAIKRLINGGDSIDINAGETGKIDAVELFQKWKSEVYGLNELEAKGNHDLNNFNGTNEENVLTDSEWYGVMIKPLEDKYVLDKKTRYCIDNVTQKMRYIILDSENSDYADEINYAKARLQELTAEWTAIIIQHRYWDSVGNVSTKGTNLQNAINAIYSDLECAFAGIIVGHLHADVDIIDSNGYPIIGVDCDAMTGSQSGYSRTAGTTNEHSFDVVHIDFTNRKLYLTRIGAGDTVVGSGTGVREYSY